MKKNRFVSHIVSFFLAILVFVISLFTSFYRVYAVNGNESSTYCVYNKDGSLQRRYTLSAVPTLEATNERTIVGSDSRKVDFSKSGVVKIITDKGFGTGFVVDENTIATAAHCVFYKADELATNSSFTNANCQITNILFFNGNGQIENNITNENIEAVHVPTTYILNNVYSHFQYDYALIKVNVDLSDYAFFNLGNMLDGFRGSGKTVSVTGFPGFVNGSEVNNSIINGNDALHTMYTGTGVVLNQYFNPDYQIPITNDISGGNSGGPLYYTTSYGSNVYYTVIGIAVCEGAEGVCNAAVRINTKLLHFYKSNSYI